MTRRPCAICRERPRMVQHPISNRLAFSIRTAMCSVCNKSQYGNRGRNEEWAARRARAAERRRWVAWVKARPSLLDRFAMAVWLAGRPK